MCMMIGYEKNYSRTVVATRNLNDTAVEYIGGIEVIKVFGKAESSYDKFVEAAKECGCYKFIMSLENGYETALGESGGTLSGRSKECCRKLEIINNKMQTKKRCYQTVTPSLFLYSISYF